MMSDVHISLKIAGAHYSLHNNVLHVFIRLLVQVSTEVAAADLFLDSNMLVKGINV